MSKRNARCICARCEHLTDSKLMTDTKNRLHCAAGPSWVPIGNPNTFWCGMFTPDALARHHDDALSEAKTKGSEPEPVEIFPETMLAVDLSSSLVKAFHMKRWSGSYSQPVRVIIDALGSQAIIPGDVDVMFEFDASFKAGRWKMKESIAPDRFGWEDIRTPAVSHTSEWLRNGRIQRQAYLGTYQINPDGKVLELYPGFSAELHQLGRDSNDWNLDKLWWNPAPKQAEGESAS